jgi:hypothetical protein
MSLLSWIRSLLRAKPIAEMSVNASAQFSVINGTLGNLNIPLLGDVIIQQTPASPRTTDDPTRYDPIRQTLEAYREKAQTSNDKSPRTVRETTNRRQQSKTKMVMRDGTVADLMGVIACGREAAILDVQWEHPRPGKHPDRGILVTGPAVVRYDAIMAIQQETSNRAAQTAII